MSLPDRRQEIVPGAFEIPRMTVISLCQTGLRQCPSIIYIFPVIPERSGLTYGKTVYDGSVRLPVQLAILTQWRFEK